MTESVFVTFCGQFGAVGGALIIIECVGVDNFMFRPVDSGFPVSGKLLVYGGFCRILPVVNASGILFTHVQMSPSASVSS